MSIPKAVLQLRSLLTRGNISRPFTNLIKGDKTLFWSKPLGTSKEFHAAFHSPKTNPAVRYMMGLSGILGEENIINRSLTGLRSNLHFKVEPQYSKKGGKLRLSHFAIKGYSGAGKGQYLKVNHVSKRMMMGTPVDVTRARFATAAMTKRKRKVPVKFRLMNWANRDELRAKHALKMAKYQEYLESLKLQRNKARMQKAMYKRLSSDPKGLKLRTIEDVEKEISRLIDSGVIDEEMLSHFEALWSIHKGKRKEKIKIREDWLAYLLSKLPPQYMYTLLENKPDMTLDEDLDFGLKKALDPRRVKNKEFSGRARPMTDAEKARTLKAFIEILKHLQGIMWILHFTIKLNDRRRQFLYIEDDYVPTFQTPFRPGFTFRLLLYGFPEHMNHYINQHQKFKEWFTFLRVDTEANKLEGEMAATHFEAVTIDDSEYETDEEMQDALDVLLADCSNTLKKTTEFYDVINKMHWIFEDEDINDVNEDGTKKKKKVWMVDPIFYKVPKSVPKHVRHPTDNKRFSPATEEAAVKLKVSHYKNLHADYWERNN